MLIKQLSVFVENKMGRLAEVTKIIGDAGVDIRALSVADTSDFGILRLIVDKPDLTVERLKAAGLTVTLTDVIAVGIDDTPGSFAKVMEMMSAAGLDVEYMYAFISRAQNRAFVILRVEDTARGIEALHAAGVYLMRESELYEL